MMTNRRLRGEQGASLVLALAFLTLFSVVAVSILTLTSVSFRNTTVTDNRVDQVYAADGGVEYAIQQLKNDTDTLCAAIADSPQDIGTVEYNGKDVSVTCQTTAGGLTTVGGGSPLMSNYVAVIGSGGVSVQGGGWGPAEIHGNMYSGGPMTISWENPSLCSSWGPWILADQGHQQPAPNVCAWMDVEGSLSLAGATCPPNFVYPTGPCNAGAPAPSVAVPTVKIPSAAPHTAIDLLPYGLDCIIMYPGKYSTPPSFSASRKYYLASGTYYFANSSTTGDVVLQGQIVGGMPSPGEPWADTAEVSGLNPCANVPGYTPDSLAAYASTVLGTGPIYDATKAGTGVTLVRGSSAKLRVSGASTKVELYTRVPGTAAGSYDLGATPGVTFWANTSTTGASPITPTSPYSPVPNTCGANGCEVFVTTEKQVDVVFHGLSYLANSHVNLAEPSNAEVGPGGGSVSFFLGGLAAKRLTITRNYEGEIKKISLAGTGEPVIEFDPRTTTVTATAIGPNGQPTTVTAIVRPDEAAGPVVDSWRKT